jgi:hypothetical protein
MADAFFFIGAAVVAAGAVVVVVAAVVAAEATPVARKPATAIDVRTLAILIKITPLGAPAWFRLVPAGRDSRNLGGAYPTQL